jgi:hypothetical protein
MKRFLMMLAAMAACQTVYAARPLKEDTAVTIVVGPFVDTAGAAVTAPTIASIDITGYKNNGTAYTVGPPSASGGSNDMVNVDDGYYSLELTTTDTDTAGYFRMSFQISGALIFHEDFEVLPANIYDSRFSTDKLEVDVVQNGGTNITAASGRQEVNVSHWLGTAAATPTTAGVPEVDVTFWGGTAIASANVRANLMQINGTSLTPGTNGNDMADNFSTFYTNGDAATGATLDNLTTILSRIGTPTNLGGGTSTLAANLVDIEAQTDDFTTAQAEPTGAPAANETPLEKLGFLFATMRNKVTVTATEKTIYDDADAEQWDKELTDSGTTYQETEAAAAD